LELVRTDRPVDLARVAQAGGVGLTELKRLNAGLKRGQTAPGGPSNLLVPVGAGKQVSAKLASARVLPAGAQLGPVSRSALAARSARESAAPARPAYGEGRVRVVKGGESLRSIASAQGIDPQDLADFNGMLVREPLLPGQSLRLPGADGGSLVTHRVRKGDSLAAIARRYGVTIGDIRRWNETAANDLRTGSLIRIYRRSGESAS
jgi:membrane-bound lytic murein transglycosylase D